MMLVKRKIGEGLITGYEDEFAKVIVTGFSHIRTVQLAIQAPVSWCLPQTVELRAKQMLLLGPVESCAIVFHVLSILKSTTREARVELAILVPKRCFAHRLEIWNAITG
jgi:sRNA-binding carbon storage regulator CsrA